MCCCGQDPRSAGQRTTLNQAFTALKKLTGFSGRPVYLPERAGDIKHSLADISLAQKQLGFSVLVPFEEGLRRTVEWYRTQRQPAIRGDSSYGESVSHSGRSGRG